MSDELTQFVNEYLEPCQNCDKLQAQLIQANFDLVRAGKDREKAELETERQRLILFEMNENQAAEIEELSLKNKQLTNELVNLRLKDPNGKVGK
jgi:predicted transcriptional regulator